MKKSASVAKTSIRLFPAANRSLVRRIGLDVGRLPSRTAAIANPFV
jgi:hypothetical protein